MRPTALLPATTLACAGYRRCHCYDSSGAPNDAVTAKVCAGYQDQGTMVDASAASDNARECAYIGEVDVDDDVGYWNNCEWRVRCQEAGVTGERFELQAERQRGWRAGEAVEEAAVGMWGCTGELIVNYPTM